MSTARQVPQLWSVTETARKLAVHPKTVRRMIARGDLLVHRLGKRSVRVDAEGVMRLLTAPTGAVVVEGANLGEDTLVSQARLLRQRGRARVWTATINGQEVPLGTSDQAEALRAVDELVIDEGGQAERRPWRIFPDGERGGMLAKFYDKGGRRRHHRIPAEIRDQAEAEAHMESWYTEHVGRPVSRERVVTRSLPSDLTFEQFGQLWTGGKLARLFPDHVKLKASASADESRLRLYVYPFVGSVRMSAFDGAPRLELVERVLRGLPQENFSKASRRQVLQSVHRLMVIAIYPAKLIATNPLPKGFLPKVGKPHAKSYLYPSEDEQLMQCLSVPLVYRIFYGILAREGLRVNELLSLAWSDLDADHRILVLDHTKTDEARSWPLDTGFAEALRRWKKLVGHRAKSDSLVMADPRGTKIDRFAAADKLRSYLKVAGVTRPQLFERNEGRLPIRAHDLRATFVTVSLALGKSEAWVTDRTGHKSSQMIYTYKRAARSHAELNLGSLRPLWEAIPELRAG